MGFEIVASHVTSFKNNIIDIGSAVINRSTLLSSVYGDCWRYWLELTDRNVITRVGDTTARFDVSTRSEYCRAKQLGGEETILTALLSELNGDEVVWDVGACVGTYTCFIANVLCTGSVVGFEPNPRNRTRLKQNLQHTGTDHWDVSPVALFNSEGRVHLVSEFLEVGSGHHYLIDDQPMLDISDDKKTVVDTKRGDELVADGYPAPDIIKIDVQGAELQVLQGLRRLLPRVEMIFLEIHTQKCQRYGSYAEEIERFLSETGYDLTHLDNQTRRRSGVYFIKATR